MPCVSVFMPSYNHASYVGAAIESIRNQTFKDWEIVVTDDGSSDGTPDIIADINEPRLILKRFVANRGAVAATNDAIRRCSGEFLCLLNSDDVFLPDKLEQQISYLRSNPDVGAVFAYPEFIDHDGQPLDYGSSFHGRLFEVENRSQVEWLRHFFFLGNCICHPTIMIRRECFEKVGLYDARFGVLPDFQMWMRLVAAYPIHILPKPLIGFRELPNAGNASAMRVDTYLRMAGEHMRVRRVYCDLQQDLFKTVFATEIATLGLDARQDRRITLGQICMASDNPTLHRLGLDLLYEGLPSDPDDLGENSAFGHADFLREGGQKDVFNMFQQLEVNRLGAELQQAREVKIDMPSAVVAQPPVWTIPAFEDKPRLHLGCGPNIMAGWVNLDFEPKPGAHFWDGRLGIPFQPSSISLIYTEHFIEHLTLQHGLQLLRECVRVLCPGGILRLSTPDLRMIMHAYNGRHLDTWQDLGWRPVSACDLVNEGMRSWGHQYVFDAERLVALLLEAGFAQVAAVPWRRSSLPDLCGLECRPFHEDLIFEAQTYPSAVAFDSP